MNLIGDKIRKVRELKGLRQEEVAERLHITQAAYSKIERGETKVDLERLQQIAELFQVDLVSLLSFDDSNIFNVENNEGSAGIVYNFGSENVIQHYEKIIAEKNRIIETLQALLDQQKNK